LPAEVDEIIKLAAWFEGRSVQELLYPLVQQFASEFAAGPHAQAALRAKEQYHAAKESRVVPLNPRKRKKAKGEDELGLCVAVRGCCQNACSGGNVVMRQSET